MVVISMIFLSGIFILNLSFGMYYGFGERHYWFPEILHFIGGFFMAMFLSNFFDTIIYILAGLGFITLFWEFVEFLIYKIPTLSRFVKKEFRMKKIYFKFWDTVLDIVLNFSGAFVYLYFLLLTSKL